MLWFLRCGVIPPGTAEAYTLITTTIRTNRVAWIHLSILKFAFTHLAVMLTGEKAEADWFLIPSSG